MAMVGAPKVRVDRQFQRMVETKLISRSIGAMIKVFAAT